MEGRVAAFPSNEYSRFLRIMLTRRFSTSPSDTASERAAVAAEFALLIPVMLMLIFGMVQMGLTYQRSESVHAAAREAARVGSLPTSSSADACARATSALTGTGFTASPTCNVTGNCANHLGSVVVVVSVENDIEIPFFGSPTVTLTGRGEFECE